MGSTAQVSELLTWREVSASEHSEVYFIVGLGIEDSLRDRWYSARESLDYGFVDTIVDSFDVVAPPGRARTGFGSALAGGASPLSASQRSLGGAAFYNI